MLFFSSNFLSISSSLISSTLMLSTAPSLDNFLNYILHCTYIPQPPPTRREQQSYSPELLDYALQRSCSLRGRISHHNKRVNVPYCEAQGKGRAKGWPRKVTQRLFIDGGWWMVDILSLMLYIKFGCHPPPPGSLLISRIKPSMDQVR